MEKYLIRMKNVKFKDLLALLQFFIAIIPAIMWKLWCMAKGVSYWLVCEEENEARDNGFVFLEYMKREHPEFKTFYAINRKCADYEKVIQYEPYIIQYGSLKHWIYYLAADVNISSQKGGKPNAAVCYLLEVSGILKNNRVFLQHGITLNSPEFLYFDNTKIRLFITGAVPEHKYICDKFGYPKGWVKLCGLCRFDNYHGIKPDRRKILLMPTWRYWLKLNFKMDKDSKKEQENISESEYVHTFQSLISNQKLVAYLKEKKVELLFCPHRNMQEYLDVFTAEYPVVLCSQDKYSIQELLMQCSLMITDYSSVSIDFAYMKKPVIYYQFDIDRYRGQQYKEGYFSYKDSGFGVVAADEEGTVNEIIRSIESGYRFSPEAEDAHRLFFRPYDNKNCERVYQEIWKIQKRQNL